jgi:hypothetical protein
MRFIYIGGVEFDETPMPSAVTMYGVKFIETVPTDVLPSMYKTKQEFDHAVMRLKANKYFEAVNDAPGTLEVLDAPKAKRGRPAKPVFAEDITPIEDAAE